MGVTPSLTLRLRRRGMWCPDKGMDDSFPLVSRTLSPVSTGTRLPLTPVHEWTRRPLHGAE